MARTYNNFRVLEYDIPSGEMTLGWYDDTQPYADQILWRQGHKIPLEAEQNNWVRADYLAWFIQEISDVSDIPQWAMDEAHNTRSYVVVVGEPV